MSFPRYPKYKNSGVEWLGEVPEGWCHGALRHVCRRITDGSHFSPKCTDEGKPYVTVRNLEAGKIDLMGAAKISEDDFSALEKAGCRPSVNDVLFSKDGTVGKVAVVEDDDFVALSSLAIISPDRKKLTSTYLYYFLQSANGEKQIESLYAGAALRRITLDAIVGIWLPLPEFQEQQTIASFLDRETAKIDALVAEQENLIGLLKEKRQAVISHAVTKGLDPTVPMKDSGIEWLGEVPDHWQIKKLKHIKANTQNAFVDGPFGSNLKSEHFIDDGDVYVIESNFATQGRLDYSHLKTISQNHFETIKRSEVMAGDIVLAKIGAQFGKASILPMIDRPAVVSGNSMKLSVNPDICCTHWAYWQLYNLKNNGEIDLLVNGSAQPALSLGGMNELVILMPPLSEQSQIVGFINTETAKLDDLTAEAQHTIDLLKERRSALISSAVTGKIDVRGYHVHSQLIT